MSREALAAAPETLADFLKAAGYAPADRERIAAHATFYGTLYSCQAVRVEHLAEANRLHFADCERAEALAEMHRDDFEEWVAAREAGYAAALAAADAYGHDPDEHALALDLAASGYDPRAIAEIVEHYRSHGSVVACHSLHDDDLHAVEANIAARLDPHPDFGDFEPADLDDPSDECRRWWAQVSDGAACESESALLADVA